MFIFIIAVILAVAGIIYLKKNKGESTGKSAGTSYVDIKATTNPVTPSMANPTADPAKEVKAPSMGDIK